MLKMVVILQRDTQLLKKKKKKNGSVWMYLFIHSFHNSIKRLNFHRFQVGLRVCVYLYILGSQLRKKTWKKALQKLEYCITKPGLNLIEVMLISRPIGLVTSQKQERKPSVDGLMLVTKWQTFDNFHKHCLYFTFK